MGELVSSFAHAYFFGKFDGAGDLYQALKMEK
jgi:hypothetical protein